MPVNPYDDRKVSLRRPHGNGDFDIVPASYTRRKANETEALMISIGQEYMSLTSRSSLLPNAFKWELFFEKLFFEYCSSKSDYSYLICSN